MASYDPADEVDLIGHWVSQHVGETVDDRGTIEAARSGANLLRVPMAASMASAAGGEELQGPADMSTRVPPVDGTLFGGDDIAASSRALNSGSLRESALQRLWSKLDLANTGRADMIRLSTDGHGVVVEQDGRKHAIDLTTYERGLLHFAMPRIREVIDREDQLLKMKFITICRKSLAGDDDMVESGVLDSAHYSFSPKPRGSPQSPDMNTTPRRRPGELSQAPNLSMLSPPSRNTQSSSRRGSPQRDRREFFMDEDDLETPIVHQGSALQLMLERIFDKVDVYSRGYLDETPDVRLEALTSFEAALLELAQLRMQYELKTKPRLTKDIVVQILKDTMNHDHSLDATFAEPLEVKQIPKANRGYPPLETAMRSVYREARRFRGKQELTSAELEELQCTFHPQIRSRKATTGRVQVRNRQQIFAAAPSQSVSSKDLKEWVDLRECTFVPNVYKHLSKKKAPLNMYDFDMDYPRYRSKRRGANILVQGLQKREQLEGHGEGALHLQGIRGKWYWQENLRSGAATSQFTTNERCDPLDRMKPDSGMHLGQQRERHDEITSRAAPRDWGKHIRVNGVRYVNENDRDDFGEELEDEDVASRAFAQNFLMIRGGAARSKTRATYA